MMGVRAAVPRGAVRARVGAGTPSPHRRGPAGPGPSRHHYGEHMEMATPQIGRALVVIVDDRVTHGETQDRTGPLVAELLEEAGFVVDGAVTVPGEAVAIRNALNTAVIGGVDLVITVGGTGVSPRDVTSDATAGVLDRPIPGIAEAIRASGLAAGAVDAGLSRGLVGVSGSTLVVNLASSRAAVRDGMATLSPLVAHVIGELSGLETS
ncbi:molybdenum cofactor biosynthesis protein MoaB [Pseudonocardia xishanensis]|uniref:Molybdenum cofactor biosynthesis protein MoaB n=2 Tax=Pseudonocardia xishanensis TaxID=630995 RepID=A0ABP8S5L7_9PSEU